MKIVICGAGQVGANLATFLCTENNDIVIVDNDASIIDEMNQRQDIRGVVGHASHPDVLEKAGLADADMIIAATHSDEVNMVACQIAHSIFKVPKKIARVRAQSYRDPLWAALYNREHMPIDVIISPEEEVAKAITERLSVPGSFNVVSFEKDKVRVIGVLSDRECPILNTPIKHFTTLFPDLTFKIVCIIRDGKPFVPEETDQIFPKDEVYFITPTEQTSRIMAIFGHEEPVARRILIVGGGNIGLSLAQRLSKSQHRIKTKIIEYSEARAYELNDLLPGVTILRGSGLDENLLQEANIMQTEAIISVTNDDETNIIGSMLAKKLGAQRTIALVNKNSYSQIIGNLDIDAIVSPRAVTVAKILQHVRRGKVKAVRRLSGEMAEVIEIEATEKSRIVNIPLRDLVFPNGAIISAIVRKGAIIIPNEEDEIKEGDRVIIVDVDNSIGVIESMFYSKDEFF